MCKLYWHPHVNRHIITVNNVFEVGLYKGSPKLMPGRKTPRILCHIVSPMHC